MKKSPKVVFDTDNKRFNWAEVKRRGAAPLRGILVVESFLIFGAFMFYYRLNHNTDFRYKLYKSPTFSSIVEGYYKLGETLNPESQIRQVDQQIWRQEGKEL